MDEWKLPAHKPDNHWFDCVVGCAPGASMQGIVLLGTDRRRHTQQTRLKLSEVQRNERETFRKSDE
jgi:hypothetical protein